jgi:cell division protein FtsN
LTTQTQDDAFHEIQLNGKQLVFLFMAATVVSVVIFLCGVMVGRGVRAERVATIPTDASAPQDPVQPPAAPPSAPAASAGTEATSAAPPPVPAEDRPLSYYDRLEKGASKEALKPAAPPERAVTQVQPRVTPAPAAAPVVPKPAPAPPKEAPVPAVAAGHGDGYAIQVAALRESGEADTIAKRLVSKGYDAYVLTPPDGTPNVFRVRVGSFKTRRDAEATAAKLQQEEQFKPWITR